MNDCMRALVALGGLCGAGMLQATEVAVCTDTRARRARARRRGGAAARRELPALRRHGLLLGHRVPPRAVGTVRPGRRPRPGAARALDAAARRERIEQRPAQHARQRGRRANRRPGLRALAVLRQSRGQHAARRGATGYTVFAPRQGRHRGVRGDRPAADGRGRAVSGRGPDAARRHQVDRASRRGGVGGAPSRRPRGGTQNGNRRGGGCRQLRPMRCGRSSTIARSAAPTIPRSR